MTKPPINPKKQRERRSESRQRASESGVLKSSTAGIAVAQVVDTSVSGLRVTAPCPLPVDSEVQILVGNKKVSGSVRHCVRARTTLFHLGIGNIKSSSNDSPELSEDYSETDRLPDVLR